MHIQKSVDDAQAVHPQVGKMRHGRRIAPHPILDQRLEAHADQHRNLAVAAPRHGAMIVQEGALRQLGQLPGLEGDHRRQRLHRVGRERGDLDARDVGRDAEHRLAPCQAVVAQPSGQVGGEVLVVNNPLLAAVEQEALRLPPPAGAWGQANRLDRPLPEIEPEPGPAAARQESVNDGFASAHGVAAGGLGSQRLGRSWDGSPLRRFGAQDSDLRRRLRTPPGPSRLARLRLLRPY
ncbi:MAG: hypothetical protein BWZ02_03388 [Lentisphaerae bacterium ADurb.BinA184]|nr:MAG: hypothetical protein BWZ02_03388 [Lentisphaerae bacterium ADurb.BinA184]